MKAGLCVIDFESIAEMGKHMDNKHGGSWKLGDQDVVYVVSYTIKPCHLQKLRLVFSVSELVIFKK